MRWDRITIACLMSLVYTHSATGAPVYSQFSNPDGAFASSVGSQIVAEDFAFNSPGPVTIDSVRFVGAYAFGPPFDPGMEPVDNFRILFLSDTAIGPGPPLPGGDFQVGQPTRRATGGQLIGGAYVPYVYRTELGTGIVLNPNTRYWLSIINDPDTTHTWLWGEGISPVASKTLASKTGDPTVGGWQIIFDDLSSNMVFEIPGRVPEPSGLLVCVVATLFVAVKGRGTGVGVQ